MNLRSHFSFASAKSKALTLAIEHAPCCLLSFAAGFVGIAALNHNPLIELGFAIGGAFIGDHVSHRYFNKNCQTSQTKWGRAKRYSLTLCFGLASWGAHQMLFHDDHVHHDHMTPPAHVEEVHDCHHEDLSQIKSFAPQALQEKLNRAHDEQHNKHCAAPATPTVHK
ncbi:MAG: hypothetical protein VYC19_11380 [Pseudomonadota bacterium]|jgi:hypothetical protein|nr:hypothetical protein [Alphaproteobacteria bacterium]MEC7703344.1 hypothetical protein [Pseudomonadota bacterium]MEC9235627.1 hypothetical protein [Pseudomonadota bacterium]